MDHPMDAWPELKLIEAHGVGVRNDPAFTI